MAIKLFMPAWRIIFIWERNEILFPHIPGREIICHGCLPSISRHRLNKFAGGEPGCLHVMRLKRSLKLIASNVVLSQCKLHFWICSGSSETVLCAGLVGISRLKERKQVTGENYTIGSSVEYIGVNAILIRFLCHFLDFPWSLFQNSILPAIWILGGENNIFPLLSQSLLKYLPWDLALWPTTAKVFHPAAIELIQSWRKEKKRLCLSRQAPAFLGYSWLIPPIDLTVLWLATSFYVASKNLKCFITVLK